jgi:hypothetical protein
MENKVEVFYKKVNEIQSLYKNEIAGNLSDYFVLRDKERGEIIWNQSPPTKIRNLVISVANEIFK